MGFLDDAVSAAGGALDALGAGSKSAADSTEKPERGASIQKAEDNSPKGKFGGDAKGDAVPNLHDSAPIEFIHYSLVHADDGKAFPHGQFKPPAGGKGGAPAGRAIMYRDALEREAIMLHGFLSSCKMVLAEYLKNHGIAGDAAQVVGSLLGGGSSKPKPDPTQLDGYMDKVTAAATPITTAQVKYPDVHKAGADLHQSRANFKQFAASLNDFYLKSDDGGSSPLGALNKVVGSLPGPAKVLMTIQKIGFSMFDIYLGVFLEMQGKLQRPIELASHQMTIDAITSNYEKHALTFPIWSAVEEAKEEETAPEDTEEEKKKGGFHKEVDFLKPVKDKAKEVSDKVDDVKKDVYDFAGANDEPKETPGSDQLTTIFSTLKGGESGKDAGSAAEMTTTALNNALKSVGGMPDFLNAPIREITAANMALLEEVYKRIMALSPAELKANKIKPEMLEAAGRRHLEQMLVGLPVKLLASVMPAKLGGGGKDVNFQGVSAQQLITHQIEEKLGKGVVGSIVNKVLDISIGQLADNLEDIRAKAAKEDSLTMEVFLGRLPWFTALMFRNTFFVMWNELVKVAFGPAAGFLDKASDAVTPGIEGAKDKVDEVAETKRKADQVSDRFTNKDNKDPNGGGVRAGSNSNIGDYQKDINDETDKGKQRDEERRKQRDAGAGLAAFKRAADPTDKFPLSKRVSEAKGDEVKDEVPSILPEPA